MTDTFYLDEPTKDLHTMLDMVRWSTSRFNDAELFFGHGTDNAWDEAVTLVLHALHLPHSIFEQTSDQLFAARLTRSEKEKVVDLVLRRVQERLPLPYITGEAWFCGMPFHVDERVLIPRSPIAELIQQDFEAWLPTPPTHALDLCTGGGCIAIAIAAQFENCQVDALDISDDALAVADMNIQAHQLSDRVFPIKSDLFSAVVSQKYDLIVTNPPYVDAEDMADLPDEFNHEPELALAAGDDGLDLVETILREAPDHMTENAWLFVEVGNSLVHMETRFPGLTVDWIEFANGGSGVFAVDRARLVEYASQNHSQNNS